MWLLIRNNSGLLRGIRGRLMLLTLALSTLVFVASYFFVYQTLSGRLLDVVDHELREEVGEFSAAVKQQHIQTPAKLAYFSKTYFRSNSHEGFMQAERMMSVSYAGGRVLSNKDAFELDAAGAGPAGNGKVYTYANHAGHQVMAISAPIMIGGRRFGTLKVAEMLHPVNVVLRDTFISLGASMIFTLVIALAIGFLISKRILAPITRMADVAEAITKEDLSQRINYDGSGDEVSRLAETFDNMVDRLEKAFNEQRQFISDASHELRTPITIVKGHLEVLKLIKGLTREDYVDAVTIAIDELERMNRLVNNLLLLARSSTSGFLLYETIELHDFLEIIYNKASKLAERDWVFDGSPVVLFRADGDKMTEVLLNLLQNAAEHTGAGDSIKLSGKVEGDWVKIEVADSGEGIPKGDLANIFKRFYRVDKARSKSSGGVGLGLSLVEVIVKAHGGRIEVGSVPGKRSCFTVWLPCITSTLTQMSGKSGSRPARNAQRKMVSLK